MTNNEKKQLKVIVINKSLAVVGRYLVPNPYEFTKAYVIAWAEGKISKHLPLSIWKGLPDDDPNYSPEGWNLHRWYGYLLSDNPPGKYEPKSNPELFRELVEPLDFSKPFDEALCQSIRSRFMTDAKKVEVDEIAIAENENHDK